MNTYFIPVSDLFYSQALNLIYTIRKFDSNCNIYIGDLGLSKKNIASLNDNKIQVLSFPKEKLSIIHETRWPKAYMIKYILAWLLPDGIEKVLCLGADMLIINDLTNLFYIDMTNRPIAAAVEMSGNFNEKRTVAFYNLPSDRLYLNAELLLMNLNYFRENYSMDSILSCFAEMQDKLTFYDQDFINIFFYNKMIPLSPKYNCQVRELANNIESTKALQEAYVIHYSAKDKPWSYKCKPKWIKHYLKYSSPDYYKKNHNTLLWAMLYRLSPVPWLKKIKALLN